MSNTSFNGRRRSGRDSSLSSRALLARMNELLARVLMLLPLHSLGDIHTSVLPAPLRNFLLMIPEIDFGPSWRRLVAEESASQATTDESTEENSEEIAQESTEESGHANGARTLAGAHSEALEVWGALRPDAGALRRQNALRRRRRFGVERARDLHAELKAARFAITHAPGFPGTLPLFSHHSHLSPVRSAELRMDRFLVRARAGQLWTDNQGEPMERARARPRGPSLHTPGHLPDRKFKPDYKPEFHGCREGPPRHGQLNSDRSDRTRADQETTANTDDTNYTERTNHTNHNLHASEPHASHSTVRLSRKRAREGVCRRRKRARIDVAGGGDTIDFRLLGAAARARILRGLACSYLRSGLTFALETRLPLALSPDRSTVDMVFSHVGSSLDGVFCAANLHLAVDFLLFLCGVRGGALGKKCAMLNEVFVAALLERGGEHATKVDTLSASLRILFSGHVVDFHTHDLRFVEDAGEGARRAELLRLQLRQWLQIRPLRHFGELFFLKYLGHAERSLRECNASVSDRQHAVVFGRNLKELMYDITRGFEFVEQAQVPFVAERAARAQQHAMRRRRNGVGSSVSPATARLPFALEWDRRLCDRLVDYVTCPEACMLNVQLNYVLFTVKVDAATAVETMFHRFLPLVEDNGKRTALRARFAKEKAGGTACVLVCGLNRKTGRLEVHNTRAALDQFCARRAANGAPVFLWEPPLDPWVNDDDDGDAIREDSDSDNNNGDDDSDIDDSVSHDESMDDSDAEIMPLRRLVSASAETVDARSTLAGWHKREAPDGVGFV